MATRSIHPVDLLMAGVLDRGSLAGLTLFVAGLVAMVAGGRSPLDAAGPFDLARLPADLLAFRPEAFLWAGIVVTIATPVARVVVAVVGFGRAGLAGRAGLGLAVLLVIAAGVVAGLIRIQ